MDNQVQEENVGVRATCAEIPLTNQLIGEGTIRKQLKDEHPIKSNDQKSTICVIKRRESKPLTTKSGGVSNFGRCWTSGCVFPENGVSNLDDRSLECFFFLNE